jgi:hypothetical protein
VLADLHGRRIANSVNADIVEEGEKNTPQEDNEERLYSIAEVALYLNVERNSVRQWIVQHNIEKIVKITDRRRVYISHKDMLMLADVHQRKVMTDIPPINVAEELKEIKRILKDHTSQIEDIIHDFRVYIKRSIYIG